MVRTVIAIDDNDKRWLDQMAKQQHMSMTALVRVAIHRYRVETESQPSFDELLAETRGIWTKGDALKYQNKLRNEWE